MGKKDITFLPNPDRHDAAVFEGAFDFLSMLAYHGQDRPSSNVLVCNSVGLIDRAIERLNGHNIRKLYGYLDHDQAGDNALETLREREPGEVIDESGFYLGHKDANDFLIHRHAREREKHERER